MPLAEPASPEFTEGPSQLNNPATALTADQGASVTVVSSQRQDTAPARPARHSKALEVVMLLCKSDEHDGRVRRQAESIAEAGHRVTVISHLTKRRDGALPQEIHNGVLYRRVKYRRYKFPFTKKIPMTRRVDKYTKRFVLDLQPDIIHAHDLVCLPIACRLAKSLRNRGIDHSRVVYDSHEFNTDRADGWSDFDRRYLRWLEKRYIHNADSVITVSDGIASALETTYGIPRPTIVLNSVPRLIASSNSKESIGDIRSAIQLGGEQPLAVYVGGRHVSRGTHNLISALAMVPNLHLALVGPSKPEIDARLEDLAIRSGCGDRVHILQAVDQADVGPFISTADFGVVPQHSEHLNVMHSMPSKVFYCLFAGLPLVCSDLPEMRKLINESGAGILMDASRVTAIADALKTMMLNIDRYRPTDDQVHRVEEKYGWARQMENLFSAYGLTHTP